MVEFDQLLHIEFWGLGGFEENKWLLSLVGLFPNP